MNASEYGIPQNRVRVFVVAIRNDVAHQYDFSPEQVYALKKPMPPLRNFLTAPLIKHYRYADKVKMLEKKFKQGKLVGDINDPNIDELPDTYYYLKPSQKFMQKRMDILNGGGAIAGKVKTLDPNDDKAKSATIITEQ
ncbi:hypothetical protein Zmor_008803 [Zophobas morio]|uniref:Uncharacterized protein n=1 Tax=Zophobas morio TaxID=2755281 RepID=A0AA38M025_9CUCU|nr:hypothetical protein Zmor_008803 [Zophobas morio]